LTRVLVHPPQGDEFAVQSRQFLRLDPFHLHHQGLPDLRAVRWRDAVSWLRRAVCSNFPPMSANFDPIYGVRILWPDGDEKVFAFSGPAASADAFSLFGALESRAGDGMQISVNRLLGREWVPVVPNKPSHADTPSVVELRRPAD
jgi:hypothetical protein